MFITRFSEKICFFDYLKATSGGLGIRSSGSGSPSSLSRCLLQRSDSDSDDIRRIRASQRRFRRGRGPHAYTTGLSPLKFSVFKCFYVFPLCGSSYKSFFFC